MLKHSGGGCSIYFGSPDTRFDLSSGSKIFTGTAITCLAQQGKIKFSDIIGKYIDGLPKGNIITIHQILTHSSGFIPLSASGAWNSAADLYKFDKAVFSGKIVDEKHLKMMTDRYTPQWENCHFGYIWIVDDSHTSCVGHAGTSSGWNTWNYYYPGQKTVVIILTNFGSVDVFELSALIDKMLFREN